MTSDFSSLTKSDFDAYDWQEVITVANEDTCWEYYNLFLDKAQEYASNGDSKGQLVFTLLGAISSFRLDTEKPIQPFVPVLPESHYPTFESLTDDHLDIMRELIPSIENPELRARFADIIWLRRKKDFEMGELAVQAYLESAARLEDPEHWSHAIARITRAFQLSLYLGKKKPLFQNIISHIEQLLNKYDGNDSSFLSGELMEILLNEKLGDYDLQANRADKLARQAESMKEWNKARYYWDIKSRWMRLNKNTEAAKEANILGAETYISQAQDTLSSTSRYITATMHLQAAIEAYRKIPDMQDKINEIHRLLLEYQAIAVNELVPTSVTLDIDDVFSSFVEKVKGKNITEALFILATICKPSEVSRLREQARQIKDRYLFASLFPVVILNSMGRRIAQQPENPEDALKANMFMHAAVGRGTRVQNLIDPVRNQINQEHYVRLSDLLPILINNPLIPPGHEMIIAQGLKAGFDGDILSAIHLLAPQIEASLRYILLRSGTVASAIDDYGIQEEYNINRLLSDDKYRGKLVDIFGEDIIFDMQGLLVEKFGANIRNDMAHGLITFDEFFSVPGLYLWWLSLRFYFFPTIFRLENQDTANNESPSVDEE